MASSAFLLFFGFFRSNIGRSTCSDVEKFARVPPTAFSLFVGPKNPFWAPVPMSMPSTEGTASGVRIIHVVTFAIFELVLADFRHRR